MSKYQKKPVIIEAFCWTGDEKQIEDPWWIAEAIRDGRVWFHLPGGPNVKMAISTLEGVMFASRGDYIIKGVANEIYACKPEIFHATYQKVEDEEK